jgi:hypothetical protein
MISAIRGRSYSLDERGRNEGNNASDAEPLFICLMAGGTALSISGRRGCRSHHEENDLAYLSVGMA